MECGECNESLMGKKYVEKEDKKFCVGCHEKKFCNTCDQCQKVIGVGQKDLAYGDKHYHEGCFTCSMCMTTLSDKEFELKEGSKYCEPCLLKKFGQNANKCGVCSQKFKQNEKKMEYNKKVYHENCFKCIMCKELIGSKSFYPKADGFVCEACYNTNVAKKCAKCDKVITGGGVTYKDQAYHTDCFLCENCNLPLAGKSFTKENEKNYCADCFEKLFAKTCDGCKKAIMVEDEEKSGQCGAKFVSFEDRNWHNSCFTCTKCKESLVGKGFNTEGRRILCPKCVPGQ